MHNQEIIRITQEALNNQEVMQQVFKTCCEYDSRIRESFQGDYNIQPDLIFPALATEQKTVSIVRFKVTRNGKEKVYSLAFTFTTEGLSLQFFRPGGSNTDLQLFHDVYTAALCVAAARLPGGEPLLKDTLVAGEIKPEGWAEKWQWVDEKGKTAETLITFTATPDGGVDYAVKPGGKARPPAAARKQASLFYFPYDNEHQVASCTAEKNLPEKNLPEKLTKLEQYTSVPGYSGSVQTESADKNKEGLECWNHYFKSRAACEREGKKKIQRRNRGWPALIVGTGQVFTRGLAAMDSRPGFAPKSAQRKPIRF